MVTPAYRLPAGRQGRQARMMKIDLSTVGAALPAYRQAGVAALRGALGGAPLHLLIENRLFSNQSIATFWIERSEWTSIRRNASAVEIATRSAPWGSSIWMKTESPSSIKMNVWSVLLATAYAEMKDIGHGLFEAFGRFSPFFDWDI